MSKGMHQERIVRLFYEKLECGDMPAAIDLLAETIEWTEATGFPYYAGTWTNPNEVLQGLFHPLSQDWEYFKVSPEEFVTTSEIVIVFGKYRGIYNDTKSKLVAPFCHRWQIVGGRICKFQQYTDTVLVQRAMHV